MYATAPTRCCGDSAQLVHGDSERAQRSPNLLRGRYPRGCSEEQTDECSAADTERQSRQGIRRKRGTEGDEPEGCEHDEPVGEYPDRSHELRAGDGHDRGQPGDAQLWESPLRPQVRLDHEPVRLDETAENETGAGHEEQGEPQIASETPAPLHHRDDDDRESEQESSEEGGAPDRDRPAEDRDQRSSDRLVLVRCGRGDRGGTTDDNGPGEDECAVDRPAIPPARLRRRQQLESPGPVRGQLEPDPRDRNAVYPRRGHYQQPAAEPWLDPNGSEVESRCPADTSPTPQVHRRAAVC